MMHNSFPPNEGAFGPFRPKGYIPTTESLGLEERFFSEHSPAIDLFQYEIEAGRLRRSIEKRCSYLRWSSDKLEKLLIEFEWFFADYVKHNNLRLSELFNGDYGHLVITPKIGEPTYSGLYYPCLLLALFSTDPDEIGSFLDFQQELFKANPNNGLFLDFLNLHLNLANHELKELIEGIGLQTAREWIREQEKSGKRLNTVRILSYDMNQADSIYVTEEDERLLILIHKPEENLDIIGSDRGHNSTHEQKPIKAHVPDREYLVALREYFMLLNKPNPLRNNRPYMDLGLIRNIFKALINEDLEYNITEYKRLNYTISNKHLLLFLDKAKLFWPNRPKQAFTNKLIAEVCRNNFSFLFNCRTTLGSIVSLLYETKRKEVLPSELIWEEQENQVLINFVQKHYGHNHPKLPNS